MSISSQAVVLLSHANSKPRFIHRPHTPRLQFHAQNHVPHFNLFNKPVSQSLCASVRSQLLILPRAIADAAVPDRDSSPDKDEHQHPVPIIPPDSQVQRESKDAPEFPFDPFIPLKEEEDDHEEGSGGEEDMLIKVTTTTAKRQEQNQAEEQQPVPIIPPDSQVQRESEDIDPFDPFNPPEEEEDDDEEGGGGEEDKLIKATKMKQEETQERYQDEEQHHVLILPPDSQLQRESEDTQVDPFPFDPFIPPEEKENDDEESGGEEDNLIETTTAKEDKTREQDQEEELHPMPIILPDSQLQRESEDTPADPFPFDPFAPPEDEEEDDDEEGGGGGGEEDKLIKATTTATQEETAAPEQPKQILSSNLQVEKMS